MLVIIVTILAGAGCFPHAIPYIPPMPANPYPQEMFGHTMLKEFKADAVTAEGIRLAGKVTVAFSRNQYRYHGTGIPLLAHANSRDLGSIEMLFKGIRKADAEAGSVLIADQVYVRVLRFDGRPFSEKEYTAARFGEGLVYDPKMNMLHAGENMVFACKN